MYQTFIKPLAADIKTFILDTLFPISCLACNQEGFFVCPDCKATMKILEHQRCIACQLPAPFGITHPRCQTSQSADQLVSIYDYHDDKIAKVIIGGKYNFISDAYKILGQMIAQKIKKDHPYLLQPSHPTTLAPIPLHSSRKRWRGFNQAEILCQALSQELNLPVANILQRSKITKTQKDLNKEQRLKNVKDAFAVSPPFQGGARSGWSIKGQNFIIVDDVTTTGSTLQQAAKVLKQNGAAKVICLTVTRD